MSVPFALRLTDCLGLLAIHGERSLGPLVAISGQDHLRRRATSQAGLCLWRRFKDGFD